MFSIEMICSPEENDLRVAELWEAGAAGIVELENGRLRAFFEEQADRKACVERFQAVSWRREEERDWVAESRANWEPMAVGERFFLVPEWRNDGAPAGRFRIVVNPGLAFGTGRHETTQLCLEALERYVRPGTRMLDVGTGAGILAEAAGLLGAKPVWACDIDPQAVEVARGNGGGNLFVGSAGAVRTGAAEVIAANISPEAIGMLAADLLRCLTAGGVALLSGFQGHEVGMVQAECERQGATILESCHKGEWALIAVRNQPAAGG